MNSLSFFRRIAQYLLLCLLGICLPVLLPAQPVLSTYTPVGNTIASITSDVALSWSTAMSTATVTGANIKIHGSMTGLYTGNTYSYSNGNTAVTINPTLTFRPGELISVSVTTGVRSSGGVNATRATVWSFTAGSRPASGLFSGNTNVAIGQQPFTVALGDLNHDGKLDMVTSNPGAFNATVRLGNGIGGFSGGSNVSTGGGTFGMALGDINNDGRLDICAANYSNNTVSIRRGNGNGGFTGNTNISVGDGPWSVALGDLNGDGNLDLAVANFNAGTVSIRLGNGAGNFSGTTEIPVLAGTNSIVLGDLNHDGKLDLVTVDVYSYAVSIRFGNGNGNFSGSTYLSTGYNPYTAALGDVNNDGHLDIALVNSGENNVFVWPGDGNGNFGDPDTVAIGAGAQHLVLADFNGDGNLDIATTNNEDNSVSIRLGDGTGNFSGNTEVAVGGSPTTTAFGDINNDGILDFVTTSSDGSNVAVRLGIPVPPVLLSFSPSTNASTVNTSADVRLTFSTTMNVQSLTSANIRITGSQTGRYSTSAIIYNSTTNAIQLLPSTDFKPGEIITVSVTTGVRSSESVSITRATVWNFVAASGAASGVLTGSTEVPVGSAPLHVAFGDINGDGYLDLAAVNSVGNTVSIRLGDGAGNFSGNREISVGASPVSVSLGDVNGDGRLDLATTSYSTNTVSIRLGNGTGNFSGTTSVPVGSAPFWTTLGDVNGDGYPDFATANYSDNTVSIRLGNGTGNFSGTISVPVGTNPTSVVLGDINGDGFLDLATANANSNTVSIRLGDGTGNFSGSTEIPVGLSPYHVDLGDINDDGSLDLAAVNFNDNTVSIRLGDGTGNFSGSTEIPVGSGPRKVSFSDINGDGYPDIATANSGSNTVSIHLGDGTGAFSGSTEIPVGTAASGIDVGDVNSDGILDIATANYSDNSLSIRLGAPIPSLLSVSPSAHALNVAPDAKIALTFSTTMDVSSMTSANIRIKGSQTGLYNTSTIAYNSTSNTVTLTPSAAFRPGELITVGITTAVQSSAGVNITRATTWSFIVGSGVASGIFSDDAVVFAIDTPTDVTLGDINNDGKLDIATASKESNVVAVRIGDGMGNFSGSTNVAVGDAPTSITLAEVNNDGKLDIVATGLQSSTASIRLGDGTGSFSGTTEVAIGGTAYQVAHGDFNGDGNSDFAVSQQSGNHIALRFGNGTGNFTGNTQILSGVTAGLCTGDINNDGYLDFAVTNTSSNSVSLRFGNGAGGYSNGPDVLVGIGPTSVTLGDVNGDGYLDIATANTSSNTVSIRLGNGSGTFSSSTEISVDDEPVAIVLGDINGDGKPDLAVANRSGNTISVRLGNGTGTFSGTAALPTGSNPGGLALGDVNGDTILDLVITNTDDNTVSVRLGVSIPRLLSFSPSTNALTVAPETHARLTFSTGMDVSSLTSATIRMHGSLTGMMSTSALFYNTTTNTLTLHPSIEFKPGEIISMSVTTGVRNSHGVSLTSATVWSFTADVQGGAGEFGACLIPYPTSTTHTTSVVLGDLDGDSDLDVFEGNAGQPNKVLLNDGTGNFTTGWSETGQPSLYTSCIALGDVDGDGDLDVFEGTVGTLNKVWLNDGTGNFISAWQGNHPGSATVSAVFGDFDGDGDLDILEGNAGGNSRVLLNDGTGIFTPGWIRTASSTAAIRIAVGDFDNDGDLDIFETNADGPNKVWKNNGKGNFIEGWVQSGTPQLPVQALSTGDLDSDGDLDIFEGGISRPARIWYNNGTGIFTVAIISGAPISISSITLGDFDGDGDLDAFAGSRYNTNTLYRNNGNGNFAAAWTQNSPTPTLSVVTGDVDGDGDLDVFTGNESAPNRVWMNEHPPHLVLKSANPASMASGGTMILMVEAQRENGTLYTLPADTTLAVILQHPFLSVNEHSTQATFRVGHNSTTLSISVVNFSTTAVTTTLTLLVLNSTVVPTSAIITIAPNYAPQISTTETIVSMYENATTTLAVSIADVETAVTQLTVRATSGNGLLLPTASVRQIGSTGATTSFVIIPATNATGTALVTLIASDGLYEVSTTLTIMVRPVAVPASLSATALNNAAQLQWTLSTTAAVTAYELYHGVSSGTLSLLATVSSTTTSYTHTGLSDGIRHYYAIRSVIANAGYSRLSDEVYVIPNTLQMLYPNGGEVLQVGTEHLLRWQYSGDISSMSIEYSTNNGDTWTSITQLVTLAGNKPLTTFSQEWTVVDAPTTTALIRVVSLSPSTMEDRSNAVFSISTVSPPSYLIATAGSTTVSLSWTASGSANISGYRILRGTSPENLTDLKTVGVTTSSVDTDALACTNYYYAVRTIANATLSPNSNSTSAYITVPDNLAVLSPNGGEIWQAGIPQNITWISTGCTRPATVTIEYSTNNGVNWTLITTTANNGSYTWLLPNIPTSVALVRVHDGSLQDNSNSSFTIAPIPAPTNLSATSGDVSVGLHWTASTAAGLSGYEVYRGATSGSLSLLTTLASTATIYTDASVTNCTLFVYAVRAIVGTMYSNFSNEAAVTPHTTPTLTLLSPAGGEIWQAGVQHTIRWSSVGCTIPESVTIEFSPDNAAHWTTVTTTTNTGSYGWLVPDVPTTQALIRVSGSALVDSSEAVFVIHPVSAPAYLTAGAGNGSVALNWTTPPAEGISGYDIYRGTASGSLLRLTTVASTATWYADTDVTNCTVYYYAIRTRVGSLSSAPSSEAQASPQITPVITVLSPHDNAIWHGGQTQMIMWTSTGCTLSANVTLHYSLNNGADWSTIATVANTGSYSWLVPDTSSTQVLVRVSNEATSATTTVLTILPLPVPVITAVLPIVSTSYCPGSAMPVTISVALDDPIYPVTALHLSVASSDQSTIANNIVQQGATAATTSFVFTPNATSSSTAVLTITASNKYATASTTITVDVVVRSLPNTTISGPTSACLSTAYTYAVPPLPGNLYKWIVSGGSIISGTNTHEITVQWNTVGTGRVALTVTGSNGCPAENSLDVAVHPVPIPAITVEGSPIVCAGESVRLTATHSRTYLWSNGATTQSITATTSGLYTVTVTNEEGCSAVSTGVTITVLPEVVATAGQDVTICTNSSVQLNGGGSSSVGHLLFSWIPATGLNNPNAANPIASPLKTTVYTLTITDGNGCSSTATVTVTVLPTPVTTISSNTTICIGGSASLQASGGTTYLWTPTTGLNDATLSNPIASPTETTTYTVTITTAGGCPVQRSVTVTVSPVVIATVSSDVSVCAGNSTQLVATGGEYYVWTPSTGLDNPTIPNPLATPGKTTTYTVVVIGAAGCTSSTSVTVTVHPVHLYLSVLLEGPYNGSGMGTYLQAQNLLPVQQPYNVSPFNYTGTETLNVTSGTAVVDWVLVDLRSSTASESLIERRAGLLTENGSVLASDGQPLAYENLVPGNSYYIVVWHRNHLGVMSSAAAHIDGSCDLVWNFTDSQFAAYNSFADGQKQLRTGVFGMTSGEAEADGIINAIDRVSIRNMAGMTGYQPQDISLDGIINAVDRVMVRNNAFWVQQIP